jgi:uncharacterized protein YndB with AHSA1/START domain
MSIQLKTSLSIAAPIEKVWAALITPKIVKEYFFGTQLVTDWQVGNPIIFRGEWEGTAYEDKGTVLAFEPHKLLKYNYLSSWSEKADLPENYDNITYAVHEADGQTVVTITQDGFESEEKRNHSEQNWQAIFGGMKAILEKKPSLTVSAIVNVAVAKAWDYWTKPQHIMQWNNASEDWHTPHAENDLQVGGKFLSRMAAKDGSFSFDFNGVYSQIQTHQLIEYSTEDARKVSISFEVLGENTCQITETFEAENQNPLEMQQMGWQAILNNFKKYTEFN